MVFLRFLNILSWIDKCQTLAQGAQERAWRPVPFSLPPIFLGHAHSVVLSVLGLGVKGVMEPELVCSRQVPHALYISLAFLFVFSPRVG